MKPRLQFRLSPEVNDWLRDVAERSGVTITHVVENAVLDLKLKDIRMMKKEIEMGERNTCYHGVPQDSEHFCNKCHKLGYLD
jgi:hypothetical protein